MTDQICRVTEVILGRSVRALRLENDLLATTILLDTLRMLILK